MTVRELEDKLGRMLLELEHLQNLLAQKNSDND